MSRIPEEELERIKRGSDLKAPVESGGVVLRRHGVDFLGLCPFHDDREPSLVVSPKKNLWHCLGACRAGGSVIDWVMRRDGVSFRHAVEILRRGGAAAEPTSTSPTPPAAPSRHLPAVVGPSGSDGAMLGQVVDYYHETLKESPEALAYLERRGLASSSLIDRFRLGYANRTLGYRIPERRLKAGEEVRGRLERLGILRGSGHEHFRGSLVVPVFGEDGTVVGIYGRKIGERLRPGTPAHLYLPGPQRGVWNREALGPEVILCESLLDAMTFWCAGLWRVTASYGVNGFTEEHLGAFRRAGVRRVLIAYDRDSAGDKAAAALAPVLAAAGIESRRVQFPRGMDANEYALKVQPARRSLALLVEQAALLMEGTAAGTAVMAAGGGVATEAAGVASRGEAHSSLAAVAAEDSSAVPPGAVTPPAPLPRAAAAVAIAPTGVPAAARTPVAVAGARSGAGAEEVVITLGERRYRVRGLSRNITADSLRINLLVRRGEVIHVDTLDLYSAKQRSTYISAAARELGTEEGQIKKDLGTVLLRLEELQEERLRERAGRGERAAVELSPEEEREALHLLRSPDLLERIVRDYERCGVVGEEVNKLVGYVAAVSRKLERPLAVIVQSASAAGKTSLMDAVLSFVPEEERVQYSALTGQSLFYMEGLDLRHKILAVAEEEGAERASYALKLLQSEGELTIASTGKDPETGRLVTHEYRVEGPVMIMLTTTATDIDEELLNRAIVLSVDEEREQTRRVHRAQRERRTLAGLLARTERAEVLRVHQNAQRLLRPLAVVNPYAPHLTFLDTRTRTRRDHEKYLTLIDSIALLHQYQREVKVVERGGRRVEYIEVTLEDIEAANRLAATVLGRSLDELPPQTRRFLEGLHGWLEGRRWDVVAGGATDGDGTEAASDRGGEAPIRFSAREAREALGMGASQTKVHLSRLLELEYLLVCRGEHGRYLYELLYRGEGAGSGPFLPGLLDVEVLRQSYDVERPEPDGGWPGRRASRPESGRAVAGGGPEGGRGGEAVPKSGSSNDLASTEALSPETAHRGRSRRDSSYIPPAAASAGPAPAAPASANGAHP